MSRFFWVVVCLSMTFRTAFGADVVRINQMGYLPNSMKVAVFLSDKKISVQTFAVHEASSGKTVFSGTALVADGHPWGKESAYRLPFSAVVQEGRYYIEAGDALSPQFAVSSAVYKGTADYILNYMRQQRCGFNPFLGDSCHTKDGIITDHPTKTGSWMDAKGGWHDASDYLQYVLTSANAVYQLLFAYRSHPESYGDQYDANGKKGANGIPDILDEARWGLNWLMKMNPAPGEMYYQIADDRDHRGFRLPTLDTVSYGLGKQYRPVYYVTGKPQGTGVHRNRTTGVSSVAAKFSSSFALAAEVYQKWDPELAAKFGKKASEAWDFALSDPGVCQTACVVSPYFYEEENYVDDLELAAATLAETNASTALLKSAAKWGELEQVTPWMELHRARHYQYYPFVNLGHALLAQKEDTLTSGKFIRFMKQGLTALRKYAGNDPFQIGVPFIWCSNNLVVAAATQARLYRTISGDTQFAEMEASLTDWLFGCNPWGTSMICGLPANGDYPEDPHSAISDHLHQPTWGGLVDGPVYNSIYSSLLGITLRHKDSYADFQHGQAVYHDDSGDYSTNEPTMDGTASLSYLLSSLESQGTIDSRQVRESEGAIIRTHPEDKTISLLFSAHDRIEGGESILQTLRKYGIKASFFFTGDFLREQRNADFIRAVQKDGHYIGPHSDKHLLYADWKQRDALLVTREQFAADMQGNRAALLQAGISPIKANIFLPPYEWYNREVAGWCREMGLTLINFTPGTRTNADYLSPEQPGYRSSAQLMDDLLQFERKQPQGLNGSFLLIHPGTVPERKDKLYNHLDQIIRVLQKKGYRFERVDTALKGQTAPDGLSQTK